VRLRHITSDGKPQALAGRQVSGMAGVWHPIDLPKGLPHDDPWAELHDVGRGLRRGLPPGRRAVGRCQVDGMPHEPQRGQDQVPGRRHQKGTTAPDTRPHGVTRTSTPTSRNSPAGYRSDRGIRFDTEVLTFGRRELIAWDRRC